MMENPLISRSNKENAELFLRITTEQMSSVRANRDSKGGRERKAPFYFIPSDCSSIIESHFIQRTFSNLHRKHCTHSKIP